ncbi:unnamed protein product (macronuclear) [Paramecium tetraurelia]|uniref:Uncharacterized protein n=1 Tax=Paramecium tetraurelia TaxID=5888 RepID=A0D9B1_PARTE|nr:uncharacterized protein GSPATT00014558001 [Paramecium tetraurelia]CAK79628.1 unnamed protein product [Paramecium tetraurelia]|eukprot:XP_001447025.1 hypothetical protein (macronuclear) [Paramecium tetraurelia strain d4-2]
MKFLIVNGFTATASHSKIFNQFRQQIYEVLIQKIQITQTQKEVADIDFDYIELDRHNLEEYLFEPETSHIKPEKGLKFNSLDMVFIIASPNTRPWNPNMRNLLIRMCIKTKKLLFMTSFGAQALAYLCASNISTHIKITNGNGEGSKLVDFPKYTIQALKNTHDDYFLDTTTGDLYTYNKVTDEWMPKCNIGIHHRRDAMEYQSIGKYVVKSPAYKPKQVMLSNQTEMTCIIKKPFLHYWLFKDVNIEFSIKQSNTWDIHAITFTNPERRFQSLAENNLRGPLIIQCDNIIALLFELDYKQKDQVNLLSNFIENGIKIIRYSNSYNTISITNERQFTSPRGLENIQLIYNQDNKSKSQHLQEDMMKKQHKAYVREYRKLVNTAILDSERDRDKILHVGFSVKKNRLPEVVEQNNIQQKTLKATQRKSFIAKKEHFYQNLDSLKLNLDENQSYKNPSTSTSRKHLKLRTEPKGVLFQMIDEPEEQPLIQTHRVLSQIEVRKQLHPSLNQEFLGSQKNWIPGFLKLNKSKVSQSQPNSGRQTFQQLLD